jgi:hypothetical protein
MEMVVLNALLLNYWWYLVGVPAARAVWFG